MKMPFFILALVALSAILTSCEDSTGTTPFKIPETYPGENFDVNAAQQLQLVDQLAALTATMKEGRTGATVDYAALLAGVQPLRPETTTGYLALMDIYLQSLASASGGTYDPMKSPEENGQGGVYGGYLFDEHGVEMEQLVEKGLFGAMAYNHAIQIMKNSNLTHPELDGIVAIFGAWPSFSNSDQAAVDPDRICAKYAARRDQNDGNGPYTDVRDGALLTHGAITSGIEFQTRQREGLAEIRYFWERSQAATVINYLYATIDKLSQTDVSDQDRADAMHAFSEAVGFLLGWRGLEDGVSLISSSQVEELLSQLRTPVTGVWTCYLFWQDPARTLPEIQNVIGEVQGIYNFTAAEMESFKFNWVAVQGR